MEQDLQKVFYAYGPHCCLKCDRESDNFAATVKAAYNEGYGFIVRYEGSLKKRVIMAWDCKFTDYHGAAEYFSTSGVDRLFMKAYYDHGYRLFVVAPTTDGINIFPFSEFGRLEMIPAKVLQQIVG